MKDSSEITGKFTQIHSNLWSKLLYVPKLTVSPFVPRILVQNNVTALLGFPKETGHSGEERQLCQCEVKNAVYTQ